MAVRSTAPRCHPVVQPCACEATPLISQWPAATRDRATADGRSTEPARVKLSWMAEALFSESQIPGRGAVFEITDSREQLPWQPAAADAVGSRPCGQVADAALLLPRRRTMRHQKCVARYCFPRWLLSHACSALIGACLPRLLPCQQLTAALRAAAPLGTCCSTVNSLLPVLRSKASNLASIRQLSEGQKQSDDAAHRITADGIASCELQKAALARQPHAGMPLAIRWSPGALACSLRHIHRLLLATSANRNAAYNRVL